MATQRVLEMDFSTELGRTQRLRVYNVKETITGAEVAAAMDDIVTRNIFTSTSGDFTGKVSARVVVTDTSDLTLV
ncbi:MAG: DUF2922 domain-containing protein [Syntrophomonadaceae bacterium]